MGMAYEVLYDVYSLFIASIKAEQVYMLGYSAALFFFIPKLFGKTLYLNPDGLEWKRSKFTSPIKLLLKINEKMGTFWADMIIADSKGIKKYYDKKYDIDSSFIAYGVDKIPNVEWDNEKLPEILKHGISINPAYWLLVARLEPENNIHTIIEGYMKSDAKKPLIIVGNFGSPEYKQRILQMLKIRSKDKKIVFTGGVYDQESLNMLRQNCFAYLHGHSVGGTNPSLVEAMSMKNLLVAHDNEFNREVCEDTAMYFQDSDDLKDKINLIESTPENYQELKSKAYNRVHKEYSGIKLPINIIKYSKPILRRGKVKILLVTYMESTHPGGINKVVREIAKNVSNMGHETIVLQPNPAGLPDEEIYEGFKIIRISSPLDKYLYGISIGLYQYLKKNLKDINPDIIHVNGYHTLQSIEVIHTIKRIVSQHSTNIFTIP